MALNAGNQAQKLLGKYGLDTCSQDINSASRSGSQTSRQYPQSESQGEGNLFSTYRSATLGSQFVTADGVESAICATAAGERVHDRPNRGTSPAGTTGDKGPLNTPQNENEAADAPNVAAEHATQLGALLSALEVAGQCPPDEDSEKGDALSDTEHSTSPASPTTPPKEYEDTDEEDEFIVGNGMQML